MKAVVKGIKSNGEEAYCYIVDDIINVVCTSEYITLVKSDGTTAIYSNENSDGYKNVMSII